jgi:nucleotide-binding universal stress UspA family protein
MFERILIPLDGTEMTEVAIPYVEELASKFNSEIILYHVQGRDQEELEHAHHVYLDKLAENLNEMIKDGTNAVKVTVKIQTGEPAQNICELVEKNKIDLIVMAAIGASGIKIGKMIGGVTDHVCHTVPIPVMLIRPRNSVQIAKKKQLITNILIPLDGSGLSKQALPIGKELATKLKIPTTLFQMAHFIYPYGGDVAPFADYEKLNEAEEYKVNAEITALEKELKEQGFDVRSMVTSGTDAASEIINITKVVGSDLIIISTHGRSGLGRWVMGSVAEKILRYGETNLLLVNVRAG